MPEATYQKKVREAVVFTPGSLFFTHVMEWPQGLDSADLTGFVALGLEAVSPFALDTLAWGFCCDAESRTLFLYAACLPRISASEQEQWPLADHVYPAFLPLLAKRDEPVDVVMHARRELLLTHSEVLLLEYAAGSRWPRRMDAAPIDRQASEDEVQAAAERLLARVPIAKDIASAAAQFGAVPMWRISTVQQSRRTEMRFTLERCVVAGFVDAGSRLRDDHADSLGNDAGLSGDHADSSGDDAGLPGADHGDADALDRSAGSPIADRGNALAAGAAKAPALLHSVLLAEEALWQADVRDEGFIALARKRRVTDLRLWYALGAAGGAAALLVVLLLLFVWLGSVLQGRAATLTAQAAAVERVRQDQDLLMRMRQFSADPFAPFSLIGALKSAKPDPIYFDSIELSGPDSVMVDGQGPTVDSVNAYVRALEQSGAYRAARQARMNLRDGVSVFTLYLQYLGKPVDELPPPIQQVAHSRRHATLDAAIAVEAAAATDAAIAVEAAAATDAAIAVEAAAATDAAIAMETAIAMEAAEATEIALAMEVATATDAVIAGGADANAGNEISQQTNPFGEAANVSDRDAELRGPLIQSETSHRQTER